MQDIRGAVLEGVGVAGVELVFSLALFSKKKKKT
jgi:hypothetical protein